MVYRLQYMGNVLISLQYIGRSTVGIQYELNTQQIYSSTGLEIRLKKGTAKMAMDLCCFIGHF